MTSETRCGYVALIGEPNVGKSTLMNRIVGSKVSIVTHKAQTTRMRIRGIAIRQRSQIVFIDTPGLFPPRSRLDRAMVATAWNSLNEAGMILLLVQATRGLTETVQVILDRLDEQVDNQPDAAAKISLVVNKIDLVPRASLLELVSRFSESRVFARVFLISARHGDGVDDIADWLADTVPAGKWMYPVDQIADASLQVMAAEITREKLLLRMHQEIPYRTAVETERWQMRDDGSVRLDQSILVTSKSHKRMIIGPGGRVIRAIGEAARKDMEQLTDCRIHLFLRVRLEPNWAEDPRHFAGIGLAHQDITDRTEM
ncbi:MAG: GTPase Era [Rhodobacteraceae bacterium]|nr:GTPase Era [Paracoccaceae bacterium]